jgi:sarcosine oxidase
MIGYPESCVITGTLRSIKEHNMPHELLSSEEVRARFPAFELEADEVGVFETQAGYLNPEICINTFLQLAEQNGAEMKFEESMLSYETVNEDLVSVKTSTGCEYKAKKLVLSVGAWAPEIYGQDIPMSLKVERRVLFWFQPDSTEEEKNIFDVCFNCLYIFET